MTLPSRPQMPTPWDDERSRAQSARLEIAQGQWDQILDAWVGEHVDETVKAAAWGRVDTSVNVLADLVRQLTTPGLYGRRPTVRHRSAAVDEFTGPEGLLELAGWYTRGQRLQYLTMCLGDMFVRFSASEGQLVYRFAYPSDVWVRVSDEDPTRIVELRELRVRELDDELVYVWEVHRIRDGEGTFRIYQPDGRNLGKDLTARFVEQGDESEASGAYPWTDEAGRPLIPYVHYQDADTGQAWNHMLRAGITRGTLNAAMYATFAGQCARHATGSHVIIWGLDMPGVVASKGGVAEAQPANFQAITPGAAAYHNAKEGQTPGVVEVGPGINLAEVSAFAVGYEAGQAVRWGLPASELTRQSANPSSAAALSISNEGKRDVSAQVEPMFRRCDLKALRVAAMVARLAGLGDFPESGYTIAYQQIPRTPTEQAERRAHLEWLLAQGLISRVDVYVELNPGTTREDAIAALRAVQTDEARIAADAALVSGEGAVQDTALNGAQGSEVREALIAVKAGDLVADAAKLMIANVFPSFSRADIDVMVAAQARAYTPPAPVPPALGGPAPDPDPSTPPPGVPSSDDEEEDPAADEAA